MASMESIYGNVLLTGHSGYIDLARGCANPPSPSPPLASSAQTNVQALQLRFPSTLRRTGWGIALSGMAKDPHPPPLAHESTDLRSQEYRSRILSWIADGEKSGQMCCRRTLDWSTGQLSYQSHVPFWSTSNQLPRPAQARKKKVPERPGALCPGFDSSRNAISLAAIALPAPQLSPAAERTVKPWRLVDSIQYASKS
ncbi:hypothetical protein IF1G_10653 [Cordyceps javanica]|uniref:Uncharacterized protein n=1 Tax=Cordyceps javanica TaxID=43265 RepID=A0A545UML4_9HYPO|nr:hypothetical protein IF1G_10653 [Cordyceps javanica]